MSNKGRDLSLVDKTTYIYILGALMEQPSLFDEYNNIVEDDFDYRVAKVVYKAFLEVKNKNISNGTSFSANTIETQISLYPAIYTQFVAHGGLDFLADCVEYGPEIINNFDIYYQRLKKLALLRTLQSKHYDISYYHKEDYLSTKEETETVKRFDEATVEDILNHVEGEFQSIRTKFTSGMSTGVTIAYKIDELLESFKKSPDIGPDLNGDWFNTVVRGARPGCFYLKSASTGTGKTRTSVYDACKLCFPVYYSTSAGAFVRAYENGVPREPRKVLFIVTEMDTGEIQTVVLSYLAKVDADKISTNHYDIGTDEEWRVEQARNILKEYDDYLAIETISDPNLENISSTIKKHALLAGRQFVFFDYIHSTPSLISQFAASHIREDVVLMMLSNQLKQLAKDYNLFVFSATQVNSEGMSYENTGFKNEMCIRGAKSIVDKADIGCIMSKVSDKEFQELRSKLVNYRDPDTGEGLKLPEVTPNMVIDVYKNRRGRYKNIRIWCRLDLGTGERRDLFITQADNTPLPSKTPQIITSEYKIDEKWNTVKNE